MTPEAIEDAKQFAKEAKLYVTPRWMVQHYYFVDGKWQEHSCRKASTRAELKKSKGEYDKADSKIISVVYKRQLSLADLRTSWVKISAVVAALWAVAPSIKLDMPWWLEAMIGFFVGLIK